MLWVWIRSFLYLNKDTNRDILYKGIKEKLSTMVEHLMEKISLWIFYRENDMENILWRLLYKGYFLDIVLGDSP